MIPVQSAVKYDNEAEFQACLDDSLEWLLLGESSRQVAMLILRELVSKVRSDQVGSSEMYLFGHYFRHAAQALEAWTKGIICCRRSLRVNGDLNHDLTSLFAECGLTCANSILLEKFQHYLRWASRYPTPRRPAGATTDYLHLCRYEDVETTHRLMATVRAALAEERKTKSIPGKGLFYAFPNEEEVSAWEECLKEFSQEKC
jgi:hypothetical protein